MNKSHKKNTACGMFVDKPLGKKRKKKRRARKSKSKMTLGGEMGNVEGRQSFRSCSHRGIYLLKKH